MAHKMLRSEFLGQTLERGSQLKANVKIPVQQTQALFGGGGKRTQKKAQSGAKKAADKAKGTFGGLGKQVQRQTRKAPSPTPIKKAIQQAPRKAQSAAKSGARGTKGWFGGGGGAQNLDKYYGEHLVQIRQQCLFSSVNYFCSSSSPLSVPLCSNLSEPCAPDRSLNRLHFCRLQPPVVPAWRTLGPRGCPILPERLSCRRVRVVAPTLSIAVPLKQSCLVVGCSDLPVSRKLLLSLVFC